MIGAAIMNDDRCTSVHIAQANSAVKLNLTGWSIPITIRNRLLFTNTKGLFTAFQLFPEGFDFLIGFLGGKLPVSLQISDIHDTLGKLLQIRIEHPVLGLEMPAVGVTWM